MASRFTYGFLKVVFYNYLSRRHGRPDEGGKGWVFGLGMDHQFNLSRSIAGFQTSGGMIRNDMSKNSFFKNTDETFPEKRVKEIFCMDF